MISNLIKQIFNKLHRNHKNKINENHETSWIETIFSDSPIKIDLETDLLWTYNVVRQIESIIDIVDVSNESFVIWLQWSWWSWKTSILKSLNLDSEKFIVFNYSPRIYWNEVNLYEKFFDELATILWTSKYCSDKSIKKDFLEYKIKTSWSMIDKFNNFWKNLISNLYKIFFSLWYLYILNYIIKDIWDKNNYFRIFFCIAVIIFLIYLCLLIKLIIDRINLRNYYKNNGTIDDVKKSISDKLLDLKWKLIIIIDDIDRLKPNKISSIFQLVKSTANFNNIIYILSYDKNLISKSLNDEYKNDWYLEKFIQMEISIPKSTYYCIPNIFLDEFNKFLKEIKIKYNQTHYELSKNENNFLLEFLRSSKWLDCFNSVRKVKRFLNQLKCDFNILHKENIIDEINILDFTLLEIIKNEDSSFYDWIFHEMWQIIFNMNFMWNINDKLKERVEEEIKKTYNQWYDVFFYLFNFNNYWIFEQWKFRLCNQICFEKYFVLNALDISNSNFYTIVQKIIDKDTSKESIINEINNKYNVKNFLNVLFNIILEKGLWLYTNEDITDILMFLINNERQLNQFDNKEFYSLSSMIQRCLHNFFQNLQNDSNLYKESFLKIFNWCEEYYEVCDFVYLSLNRNYEQMKKFWENDWIINRLKQEHKVLWESLVDELNKISEKRFLKLFNMKTLPKIYNWELIIRNAIDMNWISSDELHEYLESHKFMKRFCDKLIFSIIWSKSIEQVIQNWEIMNIIKDSIQHYFTKEQMRVTLDKYYKKDKTKYELCMKAIE